jgi:hypothetical protein
MGELHLGIEAPSFGLVQGGFNLRELGLKINELFGNLDALRDCTACGGERGTHRAVAALKKCPFQNGALIAEARISLICDPADVFDESNKSV